MIKYICDICKKEITDLNEVGKFQLSERTLNFIKHQRADQLRVREYLFCVDCARKVQGTISDLSRLPDIIEEKKPDEKK
jgi:hypothetical protein